MANTKYKYRIIDGPFVEGDELEDGVTSFDISRG